MMPPETWEDDDWRNPEWDEAWDEDDPDGPQPADLDQQETVQESCPECGQTLFGGAELCPACGCWVREQPAPASDFRRLIAMVLIGLMILAGGAWWLL